MINPQNLIEGEQHNFHAKQSIAPDWTDISSSVQKIEKAENSIPTDEFNSKFFTRDIRMSK